MTGHNNPLVSVLMNCYNSGEFLKQALDSVYAQTYQNFEIVFIDNCSTDNSAEIAKSYDARLKYIKTPKNIPLYAARAFAKPYFSGKYLAILDCDDTWKKDKLALQVKFAEERNLDFIYTNYSVFYHNQSLVNLFKTCIHRFGEGLKYFRKSDFQAVDKLLYNYEINLQTVFIRISKINEMNFNPKISLLGDYDFFFRLFYIGKIKPYYLRYSTTRTRLHEGQLSRKSLRDWMVEYRYIYYFFLKQLMSSSEKEKFKFLTDCIKADHLYQKKEYSKALPIYSTYRFLTFWHWIIYIRCLFFNFVGKNG